MSFAGAFEGKVVLITGHTGFKGSWLTHWLVKLGAHVTGVSLDPETALSNFNVIGLKNRITDIRQDITDNQRIAEIFRDIKPDFVFHLAAQALVGRAYSDPFETWKTNVLGTMSILNALRLISNKCVAVMITSDKCYENNEWVWGYRENDQLGGSDPYSSSKGSAELAISSYVRSFFSDPDCNIRLGTARAGNVIGGGDWSDGRIVPDCVKAWSNSNSVDVRNPMATRPWQHILEPLSGYLTLASELNARDEMHGEAFNFGPRWDQNKSVQQLVEKMSIYWDQVQWNDASDGKLPMSEAGLLRLNCDKAHQRLNWSAVMEFGETVKMTAEWYRDYYLKARVMVDKTDEQVDAYVQLATKKGLHWTC